MNTDNREANKLLKERADLLQVRRYIDAYLDIFKDYKRNIRTFIQNSTDIILPRLEKSGYYELDQYSVSNFDELKKALFRYSEELDISDLRHQINKMNDLISERTLRKIHGENHGHAVENIYDLRETVQSRLNEIDHKLQSANDAVLRENRDQRAA